MLPILTPDEFELIKEIPNYESYIYRSKLSNSATIEEIRRLTGLHFGLKKEWEKNGSRETEVIIPRQTAIYMASMLTTTSYKNIGKAFGNLKPSSVTHTVKTVQGSIEIGENRYLPHVKSISILMYRFQKRQNHRKPLKTEYE